MHHHEIWLKTLQHCCCGFSQILAWSLALNYKWYFHEFLNLLWSSWMHSVNLVLCSARKDKPCLMSLCRRKEGSVISVYKLCAYIQYLLYVCTHRNFDNKFIWMIDALFLYETYISEKLNMDLMRLHCGAVITRSIFSQILTKYIP